MLAIATPDHLDAIYTLLQLKRSEERILGPVNEPKVRGTISQHIAQNECFVCTDQAGVVATAAIYKTDQWDVDEPAIITRWFYVHPKHRDRGHAARMVGLMKDTCRDAGLPLILSVGTTPSEVWRLQYFRKRLTACAGVFKFDPRLAA
jgi:GNAT superfamily N-acetyltransferase